MAKTSKERAREIEVLFPRLALALFGGVDSLAEFPVGQLRIFRTLEFSRMKPSDLARHVGLTPGAISQHLVKLKQAGLVSEDKDPADGRSKIVTITDMGRKLLHNRREQRAARATVLLDRMSEGEQEALVSLLRHIVNLGGASMGAPESCDSTDA